LVATTWYVLALFPAANFTAPPPVSLLFQK